MMGIQLIIRSVLGSLINFQEINKSIPGWAETVDTEPVHWCPVQGLCVPIGWWFVVNCLIGSRNRTRRETHTNFQWEIRSAVACLHCPQQHGFVILSPPEWDARPQCVWPDRDHKRKQVSILFLSHQTGEESRSPKLIPRGWACSSAAAAATRPFHKLSAFPADILAS